MAEKAELVEKLEKEESSGRGRKREPRARTAPEAETPDAADTARGAAGNQAVQRRAGRPRKGFMQAKTRPGQEALLREVERSAEAARPSGGGRPLGEAARRSLEEGFGTSLDGVRVHDDQSSQEFVRGRHALAVTFGQDIYLGPGVRADEGGNASHVLAHEVAHTIQQRGASADDAPRSAGQYQSLERQADLAAERALEGQPTGLRAGAASLMEQAQGDDAGPSAEVRAAEVAALLLGMMTDEQRELLMTHPPTYRSVARRLIERHADLITDKLLELHVDDDDESLIVSIVRRWARTPKLEGGNYLDDLLDAIHRYTYNFDYLVSESASGNMLDKLYAEMEGVRYSLLISTVDNFSTRYAGYRGRGSISRWSGVETAVMPSDVRDRISRINERLSGRVVLPMTPAEVAEINRLYSQLRWRTLGLVDLPDIELGAAPGQQAAPAAALVPAAGITVAAIIKALIVAIVVTAALLLIAATLDAIERALDRIDSTPAPYTPPVTQPVGPAIPIPRPTSLPVPQVPPVPMTDAPPLPLARATPRAVPRVIPRAEPRAVPRIPPIVPILWPHFSGRGLPLVAPDPTNSIWVGRPLVRTIPPPRNMALPELFRLRNVVRVGQAVHHVTPLFLGGPDALGNLAALWISYHIVGHVALRIQPHLPLFGMPADLYAHPPGTIYVVVGII